MTGINISTNLNCGIGLRRKEAGKLRSQWAWFMHQELDGERSQRANVGEISFLVLGGAYLRDDHKS